MSRGPLFEARGIRKRYDVPVLHGVDLDLRAGECHGLIGENGAGKSTLVKIICGLTPATGGHMALDGRAWHPADRRAAGAGGVRTVLQELTAVDTLTVGESLFLDALPHRWGWVRDDVLRRDARPWLDLLGLTGVDPDQSIASLGIGQRQLVEIAAALVRPCRLLILDEPTAALTEAEAERLFEVLTQRQAQGTALLYISHRLEEVRRLADRVTVLRDGAHVTTAPADTLSTDEMIRLMVGREVSSAVTRQTGPSERRALQVRHLAAPPAVHDVSFDLRWGEILGFAGLVGAGRTETVRALFGADRTRGGEIRVGDDPTPVHLRSPRDAVTRGLAFLSEDRRREGLLPHLPVRTNVTLAALPTLAGRLGWIDADAEQAATDRFIRELGIACVSSEQPVERLSGGNQQKVLLARGLMPEPRILIIDEPTRGIDPGARADVHRLLARRADAGDALLLVSSDLRELTTLSDRIAVLSHGRLVETFETGRFDPERLMAAAFRGHLGGEGSAAGSQSPTAGRP